MKNLFTFIFLLFLPAFVYSQNQSNRFVEGKVICTQISSGTNNFTVSCNFTDEGGLYDGTNIQIGDKLYFTDGGYGYFLPIDSIISLGPSTVVVRVSSTGTGLGAIPNSIGFISSSTEHFGLFPFVSGISNADQQINSENTFYKIDSVLFYRLPERISGSVPPAYTPTSDQAWIAQSNGDGRLYRYDPVNTEWLEIGVDTLNGIYSGSDTIPSLVTATIDSVFELISLDKDGYFLVQYGSLGGGRLHVNDSLARLYHSDVAGNNEVIISNNGIRILANTNGPDDIMLEGSILLNKVLSPSSISTNQNNYSPTGLTRSNFVRLSSSANVDITGLGTGNGRVGRILALHNVGNFNITLKNNSGSSLSANRFALTNDYPLSPNDVILLQYDTTSTKWRIFGTPRQYVDSLSMSGGTLRISLYDDNKPPTELNITENIQDIVGGMIGTQTNISVTYNDATGKINYVAAAGGGGGGSGSATVDTFDIFNDNLYLSFLLDSIPASVVDLSVYRQTQDTFFILSDTLYSSISDDSIPAKRVSLTKYLQRLDTFSITNAIISGSLLNDNLPASTIDITESVQDITGGMVTGNTETGISVTYNDTNGTLNFITQDQSETNELQTIDTFRVNSGNVELSLLNDGQPAKLLAVTSIAPVQSIIAGTGISVSGTNNITVTNSAPDQTVSITNGGGVGVTGAYPNFTLTATDQSITNEIQNVDTFQIVSDLLRISLLNDGIPFRTVDLSSYKDNFYTVDGTVDNRTVETNGPLEFTDVDGDGELIVTLGTLAGNTLNFNSVESSIYYYDVAGINGFSADANSVSLSTTSGTDFITLNSGSYVDVQADSLLISTAPTTTALKSITGFNSNSTLKKIVGTADGHVLTWDNANSQWESQPNLAGGLSLGSANQVFGVNNAGTGYEYKTIQGTTNQVDVTNGAGTITLSTPQNIHTGATPTFSDLTLSDDLFVTDDISMTGGTIQTLTIGGSAASILSMTGTAAVSIGNGTADPTFEINGTAANFSVNQTSTLSYVQVGKTSTSGTTAATSPIYLTYMNDGSALESGHTLGAFQFKSRANIANAETGAEMLVKSTSAWTSTSIPAQYVFRTVPNGSKVLADRFAINHSGEVHLFAGHGSRYYDSNNSNFVAIKSPDNDSLTSNYTMVWPRTTGTNGQVLKIRDDSLLYWANDLNSGGSGSTINVYNSDGNLQNGGSQMLMDTLGETLRFVSDLPGTTTREMLRLSTLDNATTRFFVLTSPTDSLRIFRQASVRQYGLQTFGGTSLLMASDSIIKLSGDSLLVTEDIVPISTKVRFLTGLTDQYYMKRIDANSANNGDILVSDGTDWVVTALSTAVGSNMFLQNGNTFGTTATLGTNDNNPLVFEVNNVNRLSLNTDYSITATASIANTNTAFDNLIIRNNSTGTPTTGFGTGFAFYGESSTTDNRFMGSFATTWSNATEGAQTSNFGIYISNAGSPAQGFTVFGNANPYATLGSGTTQYSNAGITTGTSYTIGNSANSLIVGGGAGTVNFGTNTGVLNMYNSTSSTAAINIYNTTNAGTATAGIVFGNGTNFTQTSGTRNYVNLNNGFAPTSGTAVHNSMAFTGTFNQTGGANGITRGIHLNQTLTAVTDFRGIDIAYSNANAKGIYQTGSSTTNNFVGGTMFGSTSAPSAVAAIEISSTTKGLLLPRMTTTQRDAITAVAGLVIFNTTTTKMECYDGTTWQAAW